VAPDIPHVRDMLYHGDSFSRAMVRTPPGHTTLSNKCLHFFDDTREAFAFLQV
jgi:hypothetical protein